MTTRIDDIKARLAAATRVGYTGALDARIIAEDGYDPALAGLFAHAPEDIAYLLGLLEEFSRRAFQDAHDNYNERLLAARKRVVALEEEVRALTSELEEVRSGRIR